MKLAKPGDKIPFTPFDQLPKAEADRVTYYFRVPTVADQARFDHAVAAAGGREWTWYQHSVALEEGIKALIPDDADPERVSTLAEIAAIREEATTVSALLRDPAIWADEAQREELVDRWSKAYASPRLAEIEAVTAPYYPRLAAMQADNALVRQIRGNEALRLFLVAWSNVPGKIRRGLAGVDETTLRQVPPEHRAAIGAWVVKLFGPTETEAGN